MVLANELEIVLASCDCLEVPELSDPEDPPSMLPTPAERF